MKKFALFPGWVTSENDGDRHYVSIEDLMRLYGVSPAECVVVWDEHGMIGLEDYLKTLIPLWPHYNGDNYYVPGTERPKLRYRKAEAS